MQTRTYAVGLMLAGLAFANPLKAVAQDDFLNVDGSLSSGVQESMSEFPMQESMDEGLPTSPSESQNARRPVGPDLALVDYCYAGTTIDPTTGEPVDLYTLCTNDFDHA